MRQPSPDRDASVMATVASPLVTITGLADLCGTPYGLENYSPLLEHHYLLLDVAGAATEAGRAVLATVAERLRLLPCPVIAVGELAAPESLRAVDVIVPTVRETAALIRNIDEHPLAAMMLVQLLRHNEDLTPEQGLFAESLAYATLQGGVEFAQAMQAIGSRLTVADEQGSAVLVERKGDELHITLNRPAVRNAYDTALRDGLYAALQLLKTDQTLSRGIVSGAGSCFSIGGDLTQFNPAADTATAHAIRASRQVGQLLLELGARLEFRLHRACIGAGIELPAFAARVVAQRNTFMQLPEITLGLLPGAGGTVSVARRIGRHRTAYLALSARRITAATALQWGLIDDIV